MNEKQLHKLKSLVMITTGTIVSLAGIAYLAVQYSKLLSAVFLKNDEEDNGGRDDERLKNRFRQVQTEDGASPDTLDDDDLSIELEDVE